MINNFNVKTINSSNIKLTLNLHQTCNKTSLTTNVNHSNNKNDNIPKQLLKK